MERLPNMHPGELLREEFAVPLGLTSYKIAKDIGVPETRIAQILKGRRGISPDTAIRLGLYFGMTPQFWLNAQAHYDLEEARDRMRDHELKIARCDRLKTAA